MRRNEISHTLQAALAMVAVTLCASAAAISQETILHSFNGSNGDQPSSTLIFDGAGNLYGTTSTGGASTSGCNTIGCGTVFELTPAASGRWTEKVLHSFNNNGTDGVAPLAGLIFDAAGNLYGTTAYGGTGTCNAAYVPGCGTVFKLTPTATGAWKETVLYSFKNDGKDGHCPCAAPVLDAAGNLYGTAFDGGANNSGTAFQLSPKADGRWRETVLHSFGHNVSDGIGPEASLTLDASGNLYGTTFAGGGGPSVQGIVFKLSPASGGNWSETILYTFKTHGDGFQPEGTLIFDASGNLYGTTFFGGLGGALGTVFKLTPNSGGQWTETLLYSFSNNHGIYPQGGVIFDAAGNLYGTTIAGIDTYYGAGTVFELSPNPDGSWTQKVVYTFKLNGRDGNRPQSGLVFDAAGNLYGTTYWGGVPCNTNGSPGCGTVFQIKP